MLPVAGGCGTDYTTAPTTTPEQKDRMDKFTESMKGARSEAQAESRKNAGATNAQKKP
jgi:hypothetical protein